MTYSKFSESNKFVVSLIRNSVNDKFYSKIRPGIKLKSNLDEIIQCILYVCKTGISWAYLTNFSVKWKTVYNHFNKWAKCGIFDIVWKKIVTVYMSKNKYKRNLKTLSIDCTLIKSINGNELVGKNPCDRGRNGNKLSIVTDIIGVPIGYVLAAASENDSKLFNETLNRRIAKKKSRAKLYADKGYSDNHRINEAINNNCILYAPNKKNFVKPLFKKTRIQINRYVVEAANSWLKQYKKVILRYDRSITSFNSFILIAFSCITNKKINNLHHLITKQ